MDKLDYVPLNAFLQYFLQKMSQIQLSVNWPFPNHVPW